MEPATYGSSATASMLRMDVGGAGAGAREGARHWTRVAERAGHPKPVLRLFDPAPGKAQARAMEAQALGLAATAHVMPIQRAIEEDGASDVLLFIAIDDPRAIAEALVLAARNRRPVVLNVFISLPSGKLAAVRGAFGAAEHEQMLAAAALFATLDCVTQRTSSSAVFGATAPPANILLQPGMRAWFADALDRAYAMAAGLRPTGTPMEITFDGVETLPLTIRDSRDGWADRKILASEIHENPPFAMRRGTGFVIAEVGIDALQLVTGRLRITDRTVAIDTIEAVDAAAYEEAQRRREEAERIAAEAQRTAVEEAVRRAERARITPLNPVYVTD